GIAYANQRTCNSRCAPWIHASRTRAIAQGRCQTARAMNRPAKYDASNPEHLRQLILADAPHPEHVRQFALDDEHADAYLIASLVKAGRAHRILEILAEFDPRKVRLVVDALQGKRWKGQLTPDGVKIMQAFNAAEWECGRRSYDGTYKRLDFSKPAPTLHVV